MSTKVKSEDFHLWLVILSVSMKFQPGEPCSSSVSWVILSLSTKIIPDYPTSLVVGPGRAVSTLKESCSISVHINLRFDQFDRTFVVTGKMTDRPDHSQMKGSPALTLISVSLHYRLTSLGKCDGIFFHQYFS